MPKVALIEVKHKTPDCAEWLNDHEVEILSASNAIVQEAFRIKKIAGIDNDNYHPKGIDENDLLIIATANVCEAELVSDEARQAKRPDEPRKRKIPAVCAIPEVSVKCISFIEYVKRSGRVFR